ncbi:hypothetical protein FSARC_7654 [Fusarium sarcochroum]|uniref:Uncharacterized protein n=1 Tax=Fusarium sarcochroum TaxID=1208366 RepID=A0A8H4TUY7_9HYPO|nr:hypothetical protein FSARC_7654 [Fusarium sarcochroum]
MFSPFYHGVTVSVMDNEKQPDKRATRLGDFFGGSGDIAVFEVQSPKVIPSEKDSSSNQRTSGKNAKTLHKSLPQPKAPQVLKPSKKVAFADLPVIDEKPEAVVGPKKQVEDNATTTSAEHDQPETSHLLERHFEPYYKITLGQHNDVRVARTKPAAFEEKPPFLDKNLDKNQTSVFLWTVPGPDNRLPNNNKDKDKLTIASNIVSEKFVKILGAYEMPKPGIFLVAYEFMPLSLAEIAASRKIRGPELAYIVKQVTRSWIALTWQTNIQANFFTKGGQHFCSYGMTDNLVTGLWNITVQLMNGYVKKDMRGGHLDYAKWTAYPEAVDFYECLKTLNSATIDEVRRLPAKSRTGRSRFWGIKEVREEPLQMLCGWPGRS